MRESGILMHISSLPSPYGIGTMGKAAYDFIDFLKASGQKCWQILPIGPTSYGDSPYQSFSSFAGNPYFIDLDLLEQEGLLKKEEYADIDWECSPEYINYEAMYHKRYPILRKAVDRFYAQLEEWPQEELDAYMSRFPWLCDYAFFMTLKDLHDGQEWLKWEPRWQFREEEAMAELEEEHVEEIRFWKGVQLLFYRQWSAMKKYAGDRGIRLIGDIPIYVAMDSADVWMHPELFEIEKREVDGEMRLAPTEVAGCPPDAFSERGQLWGNPVYNWSEHKKDRYAWWTERIDWSSRIHDVLRIDHFRGFDEFYVIPYGREDAVIGRWRLGPGIDLFRKVEKKIGKRDIIAENLGFLTESVQEMLEESGYPGMRIMEFAYDEPFDPENQYLPENYIPHCAAYPGTHDNNTLLGWLTSCSHETHENVRRCLKLKDGENWCRKILQALWKSAADTTIVQIQDLLELDSSARMNTPSTLGDNWKWRLKKDALTPELAERIKKEMADSKRI